MDFQAKSIETPTIDRGKKAELEATEVHRLEAARRAAHRFRRERCAELKAKAVPRRRGNHEEMVGSPEKRLENAGFHQVSSIGNGGFSNELIGNAGFSEKWWNMDWKEGLITRCLIIFFDGDV